MDPAGIERVANNSHSRAPRQHTRNFLADSTALIPRGSHKRKKRRRESSDSQYYLVKEILDQKIENGTISYQIDWEDNVDTGETYTPTWEPRDNVNDEAIREWESKLKELQASLLKVKPLKKQDESYLSTNPYPPSQPIRTAKRHRPDLHLFSTSSQPPVKRPRRAGTAETARFQSVSQETIDFEGKEREIKDSYEEEDLSQSTGSGAIRVEILVSPHFDRDSYAKVVVESSQPSHLSQTSHNTQSSQSFHTPSATHARTRNSRRPYIWDEDEEVPIIPDSQDLPGSSSYKPTQTSSAETGSKTRHNTGKTAQGDLATCVSSAISTTSARSKLIHLGNLPYSGRFNHSSRNSEPAPNRSPRSPADNRSSSSGLPRSTSRRTPLLADYSWSDDAHRYLRQIQARQQSLVHTGHSPNASPCTTDAVSSSSSWIQASQKSLVDRNPSSSKQATLPRSSKNRSSSNRVQASQQSPVESDHSPAPSLLLAEYSLSNEGARSLSQAQARQRSLAGIDPSSEGFQTQLSIFNQESPCRADLHATQRFQRDEAFHRRHSSQSTPESQIVGRDSIPSTTAAWKTARTPHEFTFHAQRTGQTHESHVITRNNSDASSLHRISLEQSSPSPEARNAPETILPSIEQNEEATFSPASSSPPAAFHLKEKSVHHSPTPLESPSRAIMADVKVTMSTAERMRLARQEAADNFMARGRAERAAKTASAIPQTPPPPAPPAVNQMLPERETAPEAAVIPTLSPKASPDPEIPPTGLSILPLGENVHAIPLPMVAVVRELYSQLYTNYRPQRLALFNDNVISDQTIADLDSMMHMLSKLCDHHDLVERDPSTQDTYGDHQIARWAENISTKCIFLASLLDSLTSSDAHILILARPGVMLDILEALFRNKGYLYTRPDRYTSLPEPGMFRISLLPTDADDCDFGLQPVSLLIAFDSTFVPSTYLESIRKDPTTPHQLAPRVHLVVNHSIEHLDLCFPKSIGSLHRKAICINSLSHVREFMGKLEGENDLLPDAAARAIAKSICSGASSEWPVPPMPIIEGLEPVLEPVAELASSGAQPSGSTAQSYDIPSSLPYGLKRLMHDELEPDLSKRQRLSPVGGIPSSGVDVSRINEPVMDTSGEESTSAIFTKVDDLDGKEVDQIASLLKKITDLESDVRNREAAETEQRRLNQHLEARVLDHDTSMLRIQPRYQAALNERGKAQYDIEQSTISETRLREKLDSRIADLARVKEEKALADAALLDARASLASSSIPEVAELQKLRDELNASKAETAKLQKKFAENEKRVDYVQKIYQEASTAGAEMRHELDGLKAQNQELSRKASDNRVEVQRIQAASSSKQYIDQIEALKREKALLEWQLDKRNGELQNLTTNRRATRGSSVPKSPRMGTMSPGQNRPMSRVIGGANSRGTSPAPGGPESQYFRGPGTFGENLPAMNRFGNHLS